MSALDTHNALHAVGVTGTARLALLVLAIHTDHKGRVAMGARELGVMCGVSRQAALDATAALVSLGLTQIIEKGNGTAPSVYALSRGDSDLDASIAQGAVESPKQKQKQTPVTPPTPDANAPQAVSVKADPDALTRSSVNLDAKPDSGAESVLSAGSVQAVLNAARVEVVPDQPFYWSRREHREQLADILARRRQSCAELCADLAAARAAGMEYDAAPRTMENVASIAGERKGRTR